MPSAEWKISSNSGQRKALEVVAALIHDKERFLICQRPMHKARGGLWEFVGGKVEAGETRETALVRECREELGIGIRVESLVTERIHPYPDLTIHLSLYAAHIAEGTPKLLEHMNSKWITPEEIKGYDFCPADYEMLKDVSAALRR